MRTKVENGIKLVEVKGSFISRGLYPAFSNEQEAPQGVVAWVEPKSETVSFSHPGKDKLAIALYSLKEIYNISPDYYDGYITYYKNLDHKKTIAIGSLLNIPYKEVKDNTRVNYKLEDSEIEPLIWVNWATRRILSNGDSKVFIWVESDGNQDYVASEPLYALRRLSKGTIFERFDDWYCKKRLPIPIKTIYLLVEITVVCWLALSIHKVFNPGYLLTIGATMLSAVAVLAMNVITFTILVSTVSSVWDVSYKRKLFYKRLGRIITYVVSISAILGYPRNLIMYGLLLVCCFIGFATKEFFKLKDKNVC